MTWRSLSDRRELLRALVSRPGISVMPGVTDALGALIAEKVGFDSCYVTGAGIANAEFGLPDIGLVSMAEMLQQVQRIVQSTNLPLLVDIDEGYGTALSVFRTVSLFESAGASGVQLEDQEAPKRCGHFDSHRLVTISTMQSKIDAAIQARSDPNLIIVARTDAFGVAGIHEAIIRATRYVEAGADAIFVEAPSSIEALRLIATELGDMPLVVNVVEGGKTPELTADEYGAMGFSVALFANFLLRRIAYAAETGLRHLKDAGETRSLSNELMSWSDRQELVRLPFFTALEQQLDGDWSIAAVKSASGES